jgi:MFS family permease
LFSRNLLLLLAVQMAFSLSFSAFFLLPKYVITELHGDAVDVGAVSAVAVVTAVLAAGLCGSLVDRGRRRPPMLIGAALSALCAFGFALVEDIGPMLYFLRAIQGVSSTLFLVAAATLVADLAPRARLGQALGLQGAAALITAAIATLAGESVAAQLGWPVLFVSAGAVALLSALLVLFVREAAPTPSRGRAEAALAGDPSPSIYFAASSGGLAFGMMFTFAPAFALEIGEINVSPLFAGYTAAALFVRVILGSLSDRAGRLRVAAASLGIYAAVVGLTSALSPGLLGFVGLGFGLAHGAFYPALNALALESVAGQRRGTVTARFNGAFNAGVLCVTFGGGYVVEALGYPPAFALAGALAGGGCILLLSEERRKSVIARLL